MANYKKPRFDYKNYEPGYPKFIYWKVVAGPPGFTIQNLDRLQRYDLVCCKEDEDFFDRTLGGLKRGIPEGYDPEYIPDDENAPVSFSGRL